MKRPVIPSDQLSKETRHLFEVLNKEPDVPCVVVGAAFLDTAVAGLIAEFMLKRSQTTTKLLSPNGVLGGFQARSDVAYCLGLIRKEDYRELCTIAQIRNEFAHSHLKLSFTEQRIRQYCEELTLWTEVYPEDKKLLARDKFTISVVLLSQHVIVNALSVAKSPAVRYPRWKQMIEG